MDIERYALDGDGLTGVSSILGVSSLSTPVVSIKFPKEGQMRSRKVVTRSRARPTGKYPSWKMGRMIQWESINELNAYRILDADSNVLRYFEQPFIIYYQMANKAFMHYPDALVINREGKELWEIKPYSESAKIEVSTRTKLLEREMPDLGFGYRLVTAEALAQEPRLSNSLTLLKHGRAPISAVNCERIRRLFLDKFELSWDEVGRYLAGVEGKRLVCRLILEGVLDIDIDNPWYPDTCIRWALNRES